MKPLVRTQALSASAADLVFKALADRGRRRLLDRLRVRGGQTLNELCDGMDMSRQAVTKHLIQLEEANLVAVKWSGREKLHFINPVPIHEIAKRWIVPFENVRLDTLWNLKRKLED
jgi:DNA-binding transcriptional ArsR family regulator